MASSTLIVPGGPADIKDYDESDDENLTYDVDTYVRFRVKSTGEWSDDIYQVVKVNPYKGIHKLASLDSVELKGWYRYTSLKRQKMPKKQEAKNTERTDIIHFFYNASNQRRHTEESLQAIDDFMDKTSKNHISVKKIKRPIKENFRGEYHDELPLVQHILTFYSKHGYLCDFISKTANCFQMYKSTHEPRNYNKKGYMHNVCTDRNETSIFEFNYD